MKQTRADHFNRSGNRRLSVLWIVDPATAAHECRLALVAANGNRDEAAKRLGIGRRTFYRWLREHPEIAR